MSMHTRTRVQDSSGSKERGAALVEMAFVMILLIMLVMGIVEFGFFLGEWNELKHGAHEGARLAAVDEPNLVTRTCDSMQLHDNSTVTVSFSRDGTEAGDKGTVALSAEVFSLSGLGLIEVFLPSTISTDADFKLEQPATWPVVTDEEC